MVQAEQGSGRFVEPLHALAVAVQHHHRIGQRGGGSAITAQHVQQAALAPAHFHLVAVQQAVQFVPDAGAFVGGVPALARGQAAQHAAQAPVMPGQGSQRAQCDAQPQMAREPPHQSGEQQYRGDGSQGLQPGRADVAGHCDLVVEVRRFTGVNRGL
ncbi:hypothetical protein G6F24_015653 [Rhizopus arrhizus]|nr:hypothetical protein G6F24_015653 [Rhizopus arrhizus]